MLRILILSLMAFVAVFTTAQSLAGGERNAVITRAKVMDGDTIPHVRLSEICCFARQRFKSRRQQERYNRLVRDIIKVLPYARIAAARLKVIEDSLSRITSEKLRDQYIDESEKALFKEFEKPIKHLTIRQGRLLIKLIDRETGNTSYEVIRLLKGRFSAFMWQGIARLFGSSLKSEYDAEGDDKVIEYIVKSIDAGAYDDY